ncbi:hypothetical protein [Christiangramia sp. SM2212]|uniref:Transmembrane protein n=1 Tax=Christiangramia sediminicola TaxID=3073267 RepID=A0ABU1ER35_9FLAO|nr:hypothetical protein [Christiangramia sp. SM2212]MDR5590477.1 hypothetical protein [Christiangramia sp. SM2212]
MFNLNSGFFDKKIERPRLFVYLIFGSFSILLLYLYYYVDKRNFLDFYIISTIFVLLHITLSCVLIFTWHQDFESKFITKIQKKISRKNNNSFSLQWNSPEELNLIYKNLDEKNFVEVIDENSENLDYIIFSEIIINGKLPESPLFKLNMDNRQTKLFFDLLSHNSEGFTLDKFLKIFKNKNKKATRESIESSYSNTDILPKRHNDLKDVFSNSLVKKD